MRPRILYELSRHLTVVLERGLSGTHPSDRIPVLVCHPLDLLEPSEETGAARRGKGPIAVLYPTRIAPDERLRRTGLSLPERRAGSPQARESLHAPCLWVKVRYVFLVAGGGVEEQLGAMAAALRTLHDTPAVDLAEIGGGPYETLAEGAPTEPAAGEDRAVAPGPPEGSFPLRLIDDPDAWRALGLTEHRLAISFEVTVPIASSRSTVVPRIVGRDLKVEEGPQ